jgi:hyperosmotically inducible periplasmic protein
VAQTALEQGMNANSTVIKRISNGVVSFALGVALLAPVALLGPGCTAGSRYERSTGESLDDTATTGRVKNALGKDAYKYPDVKVTTFKGTVQLSGFVNDREQKSRAADIAKGVEGVKEVKNNITVK